jgi:hypothetical protein
MSWGLTIGRIAATAVPMNDDAAQADGDRGAQVGCTRARVVQRLDLLILYKQGVAGVPRSTLCNSRRRHPEIHERMLACIGSSSVTCKLPAMRFQPLDAHEFVGSAHAPFET